MPTVLITGANRGIGLNLARLYAADGWKVIGTARKPSAASDLAAVAGDVSDEILEVTDRAAIKALAVKLKGEPIDVLFNNAGVIGRNSATLGQIDADELRETLMTNVYAPILIAEAFTANVIASGQKKMAFLSSKLGSIALNGGGRYSYGASKAALNMACKSLAGDLRSQGVIILPLHPGHVATDMGGAGAPVTPLASASGLKRVVEAATRAESCRFQDYLGEEIPW
jgi:NAD(P)-dependent dehydrogenase (short-subunit alcohol dehydrogenase family)